MIQQIRDKLDGKLTPWFHVQWLRVWMFCATGGVFDVTIICHEVSLGAECLCFEI